MDRTAKIWRLPPLDGDTLAREDKPLFSSSQIHKARVLSVTWYVMRGLFVLPFFNKLHAMHRINQDILLTHSAPAMMRRRDDIPEDIYEEAGTLVLWRWLGFDRFFPPNAPYQKVLRGCASVSANRILRSDGRLCQAITHDN